MDRRTFVGKTVSATAGTLMTPSLLSSGIYKPTNKLRIALVGTGIRGTDFWGRRVVANYSDMLEFVGLCDINPGRLEFGKKYIGVECPTFTDFDEMMNTTKPDMLIVTTVDATHNEFIIKGLDLGVDVLTEKPMTIDEKKCQAILDAERRSGKKVIVGFNYRYGTLFTRIKELLAENRVGQVTSVDFHWYLNTYHGADYFRRWHGLRNKSGTLLVHKATHHFDLLNWWIDSDPVEVFAYGKLEHYGKNNSFRGNNCRDCSHKDKCKFHWDITKDGFLMNLYVKNEEHDGYFRDNCLWREEIDIYDKMAVQIKYANDVQVSYSLSTYSPYEGWRIAFNGLEGRLDSWEDIPWETDEVIQQNELHRQEMEQGKIDPQTSVEDYDEIMIMKNFEREYELIKVLKARAGHGGGDSRLQDDIFRKNNPGDPLKHAAGSRDGAMSCLIGIAARKSIEEKRPVMITELTDLQPQALRL